KTTIPSPNPQFRLQARGHLPSSRRTFGLAEQHRHVFHRMQRCPRLWQSQTRSGPHRRCQSTVHLPT
ncbi:hypothetical protein LTR54_018508, partial [Friedmanniomyces endolithicus]